MKKRLIGTLLLGALFVSTSSVFVSCKDYDDDVKDLQEQINSLSGVVTQKETTINSSITSLQSALTTLENAYKTADDATLTAAKQALADAVAELEKAIKANYDSQVAKNAELDAAIIKAQTAADQAIKQLESKADAAVVKQLQDDLAAAQTALQNAINGKADQATVDALNTEVSNLKAAQADAKTALENAQKQLQDAINAKADQATVTALEAQVTNLKKALEDKDAELATAIENLNKAMAGKADEAEVTALQTKVNDLQKALEAKDVELANAINDAKKQITDVNTSLTNLETKVGTLSTDVAGAVKDIAELQTALSGQKKALEEVKTLLEKAIDDIAKNATAIANNGKTIEENKVAIAANLLAIESLQSSLTQLDGDMKKLIADEIQKVNDVLGTKADQATVDELKKAHEAYEAENDKEVAAVKQKAQKAQDDVDALSRALSEEVGEINTLIAALSKALRSLVYQPYLYIDGIETIEYPYLVDTAKTQTAVLQVKQRKRAGTYQGLFDETDTKTLQGGDATKNDNITKYFDWDIPANLSNEPQYFGPTWPVTYHMNPSKAAPSWDDVKAGGFNVRAAEVITRSSAANTIKVSDIWADGTSLFSAQNGILTVGLQVTDPKNLANHANPTEEDGRPGYITEQRLSAGANGVTYVTTASRQYDDIIALQVRSEEGDSESKLVTSDYAMIYPEAVFIEGIIWNKYHSKKGYTTVNFDETCPYNNKKCHVWDTPYKALALAGDATVYPDIELNYKSTGINLSDYLGVHFVRESAAIGDKSYNGKAAPGTMAFNSAEFKHYGLKYEFELVDYSLDGNKTHESRYCTLTKEGFIVAQNVKEDWATYEDETATAVGREPLVRVKVMRGSRVLHDGYILVHITKDADPTETLVVDNYPKGEINWDLCGEETALATDWAQFNKFVLTDKLDGMTKDGFDALYGKDYDGVPDLMGIDAPQNTGVDGILYTDVRLFNDTKGTVSKATDCPGYVWYWKNFDGSTNHRFTWVVTDDELEKWTHEKEPGTVTTLTKYFRYTGKVGAKYEYIYVKLVVDLKRKSIITTGIREKNANYWFNYQGNDDGWDAVIWNPWFPQDNGDTKTYKQSLFTTFKQNKTDFTDGSFSTYNGLAYTNANRNNTAKFFFVPQEFTITSQSGVTYTITPRPSNTDEKWNAFVCKYNQWQNDGTQNVRHDGTKRNLHYPNVYTTHKWNVNDPSKNYEVLNKCAIDYNDGCFTNTTLYAVTNIGKSNAEYRKIATINPNITTGDMILDWESPDNTYAKEVLNAVGYFKSDDDYEKYMENPSTYQVHWNVLTELHTMVGVVAHNGCEVAVYVNEKKDGENNFNAGTFYVSWQRPINIVNRADPMVDAKNNGDYIYTVDFLKMFDWRGPKEGAMSGSTQWLWAYYNVKKITIDTRPSQVETNMHQSSVDKRVKLSTVTTQAKLGVINPTSGNPEFGSTSNINLNLAAYNSASQNDALRAFMGIYPEDNDKKLSFAGAIYYENNGDNVEEFDVWIPVYVTYDWGQFKSVVKVHIDRSLGN